jgi:hypothetical protein
MYSPAKLTHIDSSSREPRLINFLPQALTKSPIHKTYTCCTMGTPQNIKKGTRSSISSRPEPQSGWDSFLLVAGTPEVSKGNSHLRVEMMTLHLVKAKVEEVVPKGNTLEDMPPQK